MRPIQNLLLAYVLLGRVLASPLSFPDKDDLDHDIVNYGIPAAGASLGTIVGYLMGASHWTNQERDLCSKLIGAWYDEDTRRQGQNPMSREWMAFDYGEALCQSKKTFEFAQQTWSDEARLPTPAEISKGRLEPQPESSDNDVVPPENSNNFGSVADMVDKADPMVKGTVGTVLAAAGNTLKGWWTGDGFGGSALSPS